MKVVRDGQQVAVTCPKCGCRLEKTFDGWMHYITEFVPFKLDIPLDPKRWTTSYRDARGCKCPYTMILFVNKGNKFIGVHTNSNVPEITF